MLRFVFALTIVLFSPNIAASVGEIGKIKGSGAIERGSESLEATNGLSVLMQDTAVTARAKMSIEFVDETRVDITEHSRLLIDEFVYDPANDIGSLSIKASLGTVRYASGQIAKRYKQNVKIRTPSATIGVRGTDFIMVVDEMGGSMITLLPSCNTAGMCYTGEIEVETDAGIVILNQAFQATVTRHSMAPPSPPLLLDISEEQINGLIILRKKNPYYEEEDEIELEKRKLADFLGIDFLELDVLAYDSLESSIEGIWKTALDETDYLLADLLYDILDQLNLALAVLFQDELFRQNRELLQEDKNIYGFDATTGIFLDKQGDRWVFIREDNAGNNYLRLKMFRDNSYTIQLKQGDFELYDYTLGAGRSNDINVIQIQ